MRSILSDAAKLFSGCLLSGIGIFVIIIGLLILAFENFYGHSIIGIVVALIGLFVMFLGMVTSRRGTGK